MITRPQNMGKWEKTPPLEEEYKFVLDELGVAYGIREVHLRIPIIIGMIGNIWQNEFNKELKQLGLTSVQFQVLLYLLQYGVNDREITSRELEAQFRVTNPTMAGILKRLEAKGFIYRTPGETDKRNKRIHLCRQSEFSEKEFQEKAKKAKERLEEIFRGFSKEESEVFRNLMERLLHNVECFQMKESGSRK